MKDCLFCKIFKGEIPSSKVYESSNVIGFKDLHPLAPIHALFIHKEHSHNVNSMSDSPEQIAEVFQAIKKYTTEAKLEQDGFRVVTNIGPHGGQTIFHTHFHVLAGAQLRGFGV